MTRSPNAAGATCCGVALDRPPVVDVAPIAELRITALPARVLSYWNDAESRWFGAELGW